VPVCRRREGPAATPTSPAPMVEDRIGGSGQRRPLRPNPQGTPCVSGCVVFFMLYLFCFLILLWIFLRRCWAAFFVALFSEMNW